MTTPDEDYLLGAAKLFTLFFVTLGPIKLLAPFARATAALADAGLRAMALRTAALAALIASPAGSSAARCWRAGCCRSSPCDLAEERLCYRTRQIR